MPTLRDGTSMPCIAFGSGSTFKFRPDAAALAVRAGFDCGYRFFDTAQFYGTEEAVAQGLRGVPRDQYELLTKVVPIYHKYEQVMTSVDVSLRKLGVDHVNYLYLHAAGTYFEKNIYGHYNLSEKEESELPRTPEELRRARVEMWRALQDLKREGKARHIGVSNFNRAHLEGMVKDPSCTVVPEVNQIELNPHMLDEDIVGYCEEQGIVVQSYSPLGHGKGHDKTSQNGEEVKYVLDNPSITAIASRKNCTPAQVVLAWHRQKNFAVVIKSENPERLKENLDSMKVELDREDVKAIDAIKPKNQRLFLDPYGIL